MKIFKLNLKRIYGNKIRLVVMLILPIVFVMLFAFGSYNTVTVGIVDNDQSELSKIVINEMKENKFFNVIIINNDQKVPSILSYEVDYSFVIEKGFEESLINDQRLLVKEYYFIENENVMTAQSYISNYLTNLLMISKSSSKDHQVFFETVTDFNTSELKVNNTSNLSNKIAQSAGSIGFAIYFIILMSVITCGIIVEDRSNGTLQRAFNSPITLKKYLFENLLSFIMIGIMNVVLMISFFKFVFNFYFGPEYLLVYLILSLFSIVSITMGLLIVSLVKTPIQAYIAVGVIATPMCMLGGSYWSVDMMPQTLQNVGKFLPNTWAMSGATEVINGGTFIDLLDNIFILVLFGVAFFIGGIFRKNDFAKA